MQALRMTERKNLRLCGAEPAESNIKNNTNYKNYLAETDMQQLVRTGRQVLQDAD